MKIEFSNRIQKLPPYLFAKIDEMKKEVQRKGVDILDFGVGDPDLPTPNFIVEALKEGLTKKGYHLYPSYSGSASLKKTVSEWFQKRFSVSLDPDKEVIIMIGSKEGIAHFPMAFINPGDKVLYTSPGYPVYAVATEFAGGTPVAVPLTIENKFLPKISELPTDTKLFFLNYPNNPTSATASRAFFEELVAWAKKTNTILCHDAAYSEIYFGDTPTESLLEIPGARDVTIEFHSLSKTFNMTGWRVGFAVGNEKLVAGLGKVKTNIDSGQFNAIQYAAEAALKHGDKAVQQQREIFQRRRDQLTAVLHEVGLEVFPCNATFYLWAKTPNNKSSIDFCAELLNKLGIVTTPGNGFGEPGEGYFRFSLTVPDAHIEEAKKRLKTLS